MRKITLFQGDFRAFFTLFQGVFRSFFTLFQDSCSLLYINVIHFLSQKRRFVNRFLQVMDARFSRVGGNCRTFASSNPAGGHEVTNPLKQRKDYEHFLS